MFTFTKLATFATLLVASSTAFAGPTSTPTKKRAALDVFAPPITSPAEGDVWVVGQQKNVTWLEIFLFLCFKVHAQCSINIHVLTGTLPTLQLRLLTRLVKSFFARVKRLPVVSI
jgi:hypothetical protein